MDTLWIKAAAIRAVKTVCQTAVATIGTTAVIEQVDWKLVASASLLAGILSVLTSVGGLPEVSEKKQLMNKPELDEAFWEEKDGNENQNDLGKG